VTLFNTFTAHGLDCNSWMRAATMELKPVYFSSTFFFLIETSFMMKINKNALTEDKLWPDFHKQNVGYARNFNKDKKEPDWHVKKE
jgi:homogentisate 1,2-dioxygenase